MLQGIKLQGKWLCCLMLHEPFGLLTADCLLQERVRGQQYDELIDELIGALRERYGAGLIVHWEDFNVRNSFRLLDKYVDQVWKLIKEEISMYVRQLATAIPGLLGKQ